MIADSLVLMRVQHRERNLVWLSQWLSKACLVEAWVPSTVATTRLSGATQSLVTISVLRVISSRCGRTKWSVLRRKTWPKPTTLTGISSESKSKWRLRRVLDKHLELIRKVRQWGQMLNTLELSSSNSANSRAMLPKLWQLNHLWHRLQGKRAINHRTSYSGQIHP